MKIFKEMFINSLMIIMLFSISFVYFAEFSYSIKLKNTCRIGHGKFYYLNIIIFKIFLCL